MKLLVVDDDVRLAVGVAEALKRSSYAVDVAHDGETASDLFFVHDYDAVILDWELPGATGLELLRSWRADGHEIPVLMLTGHSASDEIVAGLDTGADDYLTKPFRVAELLARLRSLLRRRERTVSMVLRAGDVELDTVTQAVTVAGEPVELSPKEYSLLEYLLTRTGEVVSRGDIEEHVWDSAVDSFSNFVDVTVHRLRKKIDDGQEGRLLHSVRGAGFVLHSERR